MNKKETAACTKKSVHIKAQDLPLSCPLPDQAIWNAHPRVYLDIEQSLHAQIECPYCSTHYELVDAKL